MRHENATGFYRRTINIPATWKDKRVFVHFDGVYSAAVVWVNGKYVGYSQSGIFVVRKDGKTHKVVIK